MAASSLGGSKRASTRRPAGEQRRQRPGAGAGCDGVDLRGQLAAAGQVDVHAEQRLAGRGEDLGEAGGVGGIGAGDRSAGGRRSRRTPAPRAGWGRSRCPRWRGRSACGSAATRAAVATRPAGLLMNSTWALPAVARGDEVGLARRRRSRTDRRAERRRPGRRAGGWGSGPPPSAETSSTTTTTTPPIASSRGAARRCASVGRAARPAARRRGHHVL